MGNGLMVQVGVNISVSINYEEVYANIVSGRLVYKGFNFQYVGAGASRKVFRFGNVVFKLAKNEFGIFQNEAEVDLFTGVTKELEDLICPILWCSDDYKILICEYAEPLYRANGWRDDTWDRIDSNEYNNKVHYQDVEGRLLDFRLKYGLDGTDLMKVSSWGILKDRAVLVDYGYNSHVKCRCDFSRAYKNIILNV